MQPPLYQHFICNVYGTAKALGSTSGKPSSQWADL